MKKTLLGCTLALSGLLMIAPVFAHDPAEHTKTAEAPDCEAMKKMDHSKMDMDDPVMQALMKKCSAKSADNDPHKNMEGMDQEKMKGMNHEGMDMGKSTSSESHEGHGNH